MHSPRVEEHSAPVVILDWRPLADDRGDWNQAKWGAVLRVGNRS